MSDPTYWQIASPIVSSLIGAGVGAWTAQYIVKRNKREDELLSEVRSLNAAVTMAYNITDAFITLKRDIVKPLCDRFDHTKAFVEAGTTGKVKMETPVNVPVDLQSFTLLKTPVEHLQEAVFKRVSAPTRAMTVVNVLSRTIHGLEGFIDDRNQLTKEFREKGFSIPIYFGFVVDGGADQRYSSTLLNIAQYTDDVLHFSKMLGDDLRVHALTLKEKLPKRMRPLAPIIVSADFSKGAAMFPDAAKYQDYETMFVHSRVLGRGHWAEEFEALAFAQYETDEVDHI